MFLLVLGFVLVHCATIAIVARRLRRRERWPSEHVPGERLTVLVPVAGLAETDAPAALTALRLAAPGVEIIFCAFDETEPIVAPLRAGLLAKPNAGARLITGRSRVSRNPKLDNLEKGYNAARDGLIMMVDGNVEIEDRLAARAIRLFDAGTGLVSAVPVATDPQGFAAVVECAFLNTLYARWQLLSDEAGFGFAHGKLLVFHRAIIDRAGGIAALAADTAEDCSATKLVRGMGLKVRLLIHPIAQPVGRRSLGGVFNRFLRWARMRRESFPGLYGVECLMTPAVPSVLASFAAFNAGQSTAAAVLSLLLIWYGAEAALAKAVGWPCPALFIPACMVRDVMALAIWPAAILKRGYAWRGQSITRLTVRSG